MKMSTTETLTPAPKDAILAANEAPIAIALEPIRAAVEQDQDPSTSLAEPDSATIKPSGVKLALIFVSFTLFLLLGGLDVNIVATAVPAITDHFHTVADVGWYYTAYRLSSSSLQFAFGKLYKLFPTKRLFILSNAIFLCGSVLCAAAVSSPMFVLGRAVTGVGVAGGSAGFFKLLVDVVPLQKRPLLTSIFGLIEGLSSILSPVVGGLIVQNLSWRWCFWINLPLGGTGLLALIFFLPETSPERPNLTWQETLRQLDIIGTLILVPSLAALFIALNWGGLKYSWNSPTIIALFVVFGILSTAFAVDQVVQGDAAVLPVRIVKNRSVMAGSILITAIASSVSIQEYYAPAFFQGALGYRPARSGYMMLPVIVATTVAMLIQGGGTSYIGYINPFMIVSAILLPIGAGLLTTWALTTSVVKIVCTFALVGFATGLGFMCPAAAVQASLPASDVPLGMAVILFSQNFGPALFVAVAQAIFTNRLAANLQQLAPDSNVKYIESLGLSEIKHAFDGEKLQHVLLALSDSVTQTWYLALGLASFAIVGAALTKWSSVKEKKA